MSNCRGSAVAVLRWSSTSPSCADADSYGPDCSEKHRDSPIAA